MTQLTPKEINMLIEAVAFFANNVESSAEGFVNVILSMGGNSEEAEEAKENIRRRRLERQEQGILLQAKLITIRNEIEADEKKVLISDLTKSLNNEKGDNKDGSR